MALDAILLRFGLPAVVVGAGIEGEPFAIMGGVLAQHRSFPLWAAAAAAILGAFLVDQFWFAAGRWARSNRYLRLAERRGFARALEMLERHSSRFVLAFRFAYGIRAVAPIAIGASRIPTWKYVALELPAAIVWGTVFTWLGFRYGRLIQSWQLGSAGWIASIGLLLVLTLGLPLYRLLGPAGRASRRSIPSQQPAIETVD